MAETKKYTVVHPVRHDGKLHERGTSISLNDEDAARLLSRGVIGTGATEVVQVVVAGPSTAETLASFQRLSAMNREQLVEYGRDTYGLSLASDDRKEALISAIHDRYVSTYVPATETAAE